MTTIAQLIASHKAALAKMREMEDGPDTRKYDGAVYSREEPEEEDRLEAIRMAAEAWLVERAIFSV